MDFKIDFEKVLKDMAESAIPKLISGGTAAAKIAQTEFQKYLLSVKNVNELLSEHEIDKEDADFLMGVNRSALQVALLTASGINRLAVESAINAALNVLNSALEAALGTAAKSIVL